MKDAWVLVTIAGIAAITVLTRSFFFVSSREWRLPPWVDGSLAFAPIAALAAVVGPEIVMAGGHVIDSWRNARLASVVAAALWYVWRRGLLGTIVVGMAAYLPLHLLLGW